MSESEITAPAKNRLEGIDFARAIAIVGMTVVNFSIHIGHAEGRVVDGMVQGFVLIWPAQDPEEARRLSAEIAELETRGKAAVNEAVRAGSEQFQTKAG